MAIGNPVSLTSQVASKTISIIATASQTAFTVTGGYRINQLAVFRNGVRLVDSRDYEARDGATVTLLSAASDGDAMEFQVFDAFQVADTINPYSTYQTIDGNLNITGIITAATFSITDLDVRNITAVAATFTGQVTYEDVTNVDSIGIATFRDNVNIGVGGTTAFFDVNNGRFGVGTSSPEELLHLKKDDNTFATIKLSTGVAGENVYISNLGSTGRGGNRINRLELDGAANGHALALCSYTHTEFHVGGVDNEKARIDGSGRLLVGTTGSLHHNAQLQTAGTGYYGYNHFQFSNDEYAPTISVKKSRGTTVGANTVVQNGDRIGTFSFFGADGSSYINGAEITSFVDGTPGANDMPGRLVFATTADGAAEPTERLRINSSGNVGIGSTVPQNVFDVEGNEHTKLLVGTTGTGYATGLQITHAKGNAAEQKWQLQTDASSDGNLKIRNATSDTDHVFFDADNDETTFAGGVIVSGITTATQLYEGTTRVATSGKAIAMALIFG